MSAPSADDVLLCAAVCGCFDPAALLSDCDETAFRDLSSLLAKCCDEVIAKGRYSWRMRAEPRREALARLTTPEKARACLAATAQLIGADDPFADELRLHLGGRRARNMNGSDERLSAARFALSAPTLAASRELIGARAESLLRAIETEQAEVTLDYVIPRGRTLFGRSGDLARLEAYALGAGASDPRPIVVSGDGGVGKSALLVTLIRRLRRREGVAVVQLDFDRPNLAGGDPAEIAREFLRSLERALPRLLSHNADAAPAQKTLASVRERLVSRRRAEGLPLITKSGAPLLTESGQPILAQDMIVEVRAEEQFSVASSQLGTLSRVLPPETLSASLLIVVDTFEIAMMRGPETVKRTLDLFRFLRERFGFVRLRVILSGRAIEERLAPANAPQFAQDLAPAELWFRLEGVDARAGAAILNQLDKDFDSLPDRAQRLAAARALDGHPLALKIFHLYVRDKDPATITKILRDLSADEGFARETALRFLYGRILDRISERRVKAMARPGLILRRVSPDLIRLVLAGPCGLGKIDAAQAATLFAQLVSNYWLIEEPGAGVVRHRADLRRQMLPALLVDLPEQARALNDGAAAYYEKGPAPDDPGFAAWRALDADECDAEAIYHRALTEQPPPPEFEPERAKRIRDRIGEDLLLLKKPWRIVILASAGAWREIDQAWIDEKALAPLAPVLRRKLIGLASESMITSGDAVRARQILKLSPTGEMTPVGEDEDVSALDGVEETVARASSLRERGLEVRAAFEQADIATAAELGRTLLKPFLDAASDWPAEPGDLWLAALAVAVIEPGFRPPIAPVEDDNGAQLDDLNRLAIEMLIAGRSRVGPTILRRVRASQSLDALHFIALLSAFGAEGLHRQETGARTAFSKGRTSLPFLFAVLQGSPRRVAFPDLEPFELGPLTHEVVANLGEAPRKSQIDAIYSADDGVTFRSDNLNLKALSGYLPSLRGLSPELHEAAALVLAQSGAGDIHGWIDEVATKVRWWPSDLRFATPGDRGGELPRFDKRDAFPVVVSADRCGILRDLLQWLAARDGRARDLLAIHDIVTERLFSFTHSR